MALVGVDALPEDIAAGESAPASVCPSAEAASSAMPLERRPAGPPMALRNEGDGGSMGLALVGVRILSSTSPGPP